MVGRRARKAACECVPTVILLSVEYQEGRATVTVASTKRSLLHRSDAPAATDASGELDFGNIDVFSAVDRDGERAWEISGDWGELLTVEPSVNVAFE